MNLLICVGENYRSFMFLNQYAQSIAKAMFGILDSIIFVQEFGSLLENIKVESIKNAQCLVVCAKENFEGILKNLEAFDGKDVREESINVNAMCVKNAQLQMVLLDLQSVTQKELAQLLKMQGVTRGFENVQSLLYLYPLGIEATSAQMLLSKIAKNFNVCVNALNTQVHLEILSAQGEDLQGFKNVIKATFGDKIFATFDLVESIIALLESKKLKITSVESCTGGLIASMLTRKSGASNVYDGGVISYANSIKESWLGVSAENLKRFGAVSEEVVREMLRGVLKLSGADFALATSGVAGPSGGSASKPVGTVYIGVKSIDGREIVERLHFNGDRNYIQEQATLYAYLLFLKVFLNYY